MNIDTIARFLGERRRYRQILRELAAYTDRELADIGVDRSAIPEIARQGARG
ncbi:MAG: DUF1127 domain-containing protein [Hyphomicrobiales bacterium]|nr:DUF1127 domain-containing protein [Hyphomicrobiales bacterium]MDE2018185.1 DUF1127 domain-containing protein [Hyphomicrobiales bacterium]